MTPEEKQNIIWMFMEATTDTQVRGVVNAFKHKFEVDPTLYIYAAQALRRIEQINKEKERIPTQYLN